mmetsp:Transcript_42191/g.75568  ORF Transcript_42191/g.75568 Transcript_42191/m.75568 type:complete len:232 (+) Transcript_42191:179-874(+)
MSTVSCRTVLQVLCTARPRNTIPTLHLAPNVRIGWPTLCCDCCWRHAITRIVPRTVVVCARLQFCVSIPVLVGGVAEYVYIGWAKVANSGHLMSVVLVHLREPHTFSIGLAWFAFLMTWCTCNQFPPLHQEWHYFLKPRFSDHPSPPPFQDRIVTRLDCTRTSAPLYSPVFPAPLCRPVGRLVAQYCKRNAAYTAVCRIRNAVGQVVHIRTASYLFVCGWEPQEGQGPRTK